MKGFGVPMYLLTVPGRKSGQPRTTPVSVLEYDGQRYVTSPYGIVDWVRNARAAGQATLTRGRRTEQVRMIELPASEAGPFLQRFIKGGNPITRYFDVTKDSSPEDFLRAAAVHPVFLFQSVTEAASDAPGATTRGARQTRSA